MPSRTGEPGFSRFRVGETDVVLSKGFKSLEATCSFKANKPMSLLSVPSEKALNRKGRLKERNLAKKRNGKSNSRLHEKGTWLGIGQCDVSRCHVGEEPARPAEPPHSSAVKLSRGDRRRKGR